MPQVKFMFPVLFLGALVFFAACTADNKKADSAQAVETYLRSMVDRDFNRSIAASCADWEAQAKVEFDSFAAVKLSLNELECREVGREDPFTLISCTGSIIANYGAEDLEIDVAERTYLVIDEGGEWRMCGYAKE